LSSLSFHETVAQIPGGVRKDSIRQNSTARIVGGREITDVYVILRLNLSLKASNSCRLMYSSWLSGSQDMS
jgi:hypothetical protein